MIRLFRLRHSSDPDCRCVWCYLANYRLGRAYWRDRALKLEAEMLTVELWNDLVTENERLRDENRAMRLQLDTTTFALRDIGRIVDAALEKLYPDNCRCLDGTYCHQVAYPDPRP